jgi:hypothetical protein
VRNPLAGNQQRILERSVPATGRRTADGRGADAATARAGRAKRRRRFLCMYDIAFRTDIAYIQLTVVRPARKERHRRRTQCAQAEREEKVRGENGPTSIASPANSTSIAPQKEIESSLTVGLSQWRIAKVDLRTSASETSSVKRSA